MNPDYFSPDPSKLLPSFASFQPSSPASVRRPSTANNHSTVPTLHRRTSSVSMPGSYVG